MTGPAATLAATLPPLAPAGNGSVAYPETTGPRSRATLAPEPANPPPHDEATLGHATRERVLESISRGLGVATSRRSWATQLGVSRCTLDKLIVGLEAEGLIQVSTSKGRGTSVRLAGKPRLALVSST